MLHKDRRANLQVVNPSASPRRIRPLRGWTQPSDTLSVIWNLAIVFLVGMGTVCADPGSRDVDAVLALHGLCPEANALAKEAEGLWRGVAPKTAAMYELRQAKQYDKLVPRDIQDVHLAGLRIERIAGYLREMGEPASKDLQFRGVYLKKQGSFAGYDYATETQRGKQLYETTKANLTRSKKNTAATVKKIGDLAERGMLEAAEQKLDEAIDDLHADLVWLNPVEKEVFTRPFDPLGIIHQQRSKMRTQANVVQLQTALNKQFPKVDALVATVRSAAQTIQETGSCQIEGKTYTGPQAFVRICQKWQLAHVAIVRCQAINWALTTIGSGVNQDWSSLAATWNEKMIEALPSLIAADTKRLNGQSVKAVYGEYVAAIGPQLRRTSGAPLAQACTEALHTMAASDGETLNAAVQYQKATGEVLGWRRRLATAKAKKRSEQFPALTEQFQNANQSEDDYVGLLNKQGESQVAPTLRTRAPLALGRPVEKLMNQRATAQNLLRLPGNGRFSMAAYLGRTYANIPAGVDVTEQLASLRRDLLVSEASPPLSLEAGAAIDSANRMDWISAGGKIKGLYLEGVISRMASLPNAMLYLTPMKQLAGDGEDKTLALDQVLMRFDVLPEWVQHETFVVDLP